MLGERNAQVMRVKEVQNRHFLADQINDHYRRKFADKHDKIMNER